MRGNDRQMVQVAPPAVVSAEDGADDDTIGVRRDQAQAGIASQIGGDGLARIGIAETDAFARAPQREHRVVVGEREIAQAIGGRKGVRE